MRTYDAIIIGSGQGGTPLAKKLAKAGYKTALLEKEFIGGTCVNRGCTPTKTMIASARIAWLLNNSKQMGIHTGSLAVDIEKVIERKDKIVESFRERSEANLESIAGLDIIYGEASFTGSKMIRLITAQGKNVLLTAENIFINAGSTPTIPEIRGIEEINYLTSTTILDLKVVPEHLLIIGGSYIALEFGQMYRRFGSKVTIVEQAAGFLEKEDEEVAAELKKILEDEGINILTAAELRSIKKNTPNNSLTAIMNMDGHRKSVTCSHVLLAVGRSPRTKSLNLHLAGVKTSQKGFIRVNNRLQTNIKGIYALGDIKGGPAFTHISYNDHLVIMGNLLGNKPASIKNRMVPYCMFTDPQLGRIGITEKEAKAQGLKYQVAMIKMDKVARAIETGDTRGLIKAVVDIKSGRILGVAVLGSQGGEIMAVLQMAMMGKITYPEIRNMVFAHPTYAESLNNLFMTLDKK
jgi:pyruvate/2-oxoglutarate dehydrogenase complex dihydrolipoamide dehydrogenase (E3) component